MEKHQIKDMDDDLRSPTGEVMNDGIGQMSPKLAKMITERLRLEEVPSGFQARIGPYKGFWIVGDPCLHDDELWIEGYPSQKKWECAMEDADHRTFEVMNWSGRLVPAALNEQFIPVLEDRAPHPQGMVDAISGLLADTVNVYLEEQTRAAREPVALFAWADQNSLASRKERLAARRVPFLGGLPNSDEETLKLLLGAGFDLGLPYARELTERLARQRCEGLKEKTKVSVPRSAYAFMTVDFLGVLAEGEVHMSFSRGTECDTRPSGEDGVPRNELHGHDVLVARAPAHFQSDIQKVRAVFRPELRHLQDVIVFPRQGNVALADLLSGGDYDGDRAWVCWDQNIVGNFENAAAPEKPDLFKKHPGDTGGYLSKDKQTFTDILQGCGDDPDAATSEFLKASFAFNMQPQLLGICTVHKERVCYKQRSVRGRAAVALSTLVAHLVDQKKQGIVFSDADFARLKRDLVGVQLGDGEEPAYKTDRRPAVVEHVLDVLKFEVAIPLIEEGLRAFTQAVAGMEGGCSTDADLLYYFEDLEVLAAGSKPAERRDASETAYKALGDALREDLHAVHDLWREKDGPHPSFQARAEAAHRAWLAVQPCSAALENHCVRTKLLGPQGDDDSFSYWGKLKASVGYRLFHRVGPRFLWRVAGEQLLRIKAERRCVRKGQAVALVPGVYAALRADRKMVRALTEEDAVGDVGSVLEGLESGDEDWDDL